MIFRAMTIILKEFTYKSNSQNLVKLMMPRIQSTNQIRSYLIFSAYLLVSQADQVFATDFSLVLKAIGLAVEVLPFFHGLSSQSSKKLEKEQPTTRGIFPASEENSALEEQNNKIQPLESGG